MNTTLIFALILLAIVPEAYPIKCYVCSNSDGNCKSNEKDCTSSANACLKVTDGKAVAKTCTSSVGCNAAKKVCEKKGKCKAYCCTKDLCNGSFNLKPLAAGILVLAPAVAILQYFM